MQELAKQIQRHCGRRSGAAAARAENAARRRAYFAGVVRAVVERLIGPGAVRAIDDGLPREAITPGADFDAHASRKLDGAARAAVAGLEVPVAIEALSADAHDLFRPLYEDIFPRAERHAQGEYYTPEWLVDRTLDLAEDSFRQGSHRLLDPTCGSGAFLVRAIARRRAQAGDKRSGVLDELLDGVVGMDLNPLAVLTARANWLLAAAPLLPRGTATIPRPPVFRRDAIEPGESCPTDANTGGDAGPDTAGRNDAHCNDTHRNDAHLDAARFDVVVGNPPWIAWDNLPDELKRATLPLWRRYGLFTLDSNAARHGGAKKDLSMLVISAVADRYLRDGGRLAMIISRSLLQTRGAGSGFRRFRLGEDGPPLEVVEVHDVTALRAFRGAASQPAVIVLRKGRPTRYPVPYVRWRKSESTKGSPGTMNTFGHEQLWAAPSDPHEAGSAWMIHAQREAAIGPTPGMGPARDASSEGAPPCDSARSVHRASAAARQSKVQRYRAQLGANAAGANGVYWIEVLERREDGVLRVRNLPRHSRRELPRVEAEIEPGLVFPLLRWRDVAEFHARPSGHLILPQDTERRTGITPERMRSEYPMTLGYLERFESALRQRAAYRRYQSRGPFYSMYNVSPATLAPIKVVWRRMDRRLRAAVLQTIDDPLLGCRPVVPQETCVIVPCETTDEAHYLCAVLNSEHIAHRVASLSVVGGKGFGSPGILDQLPIEPYDHGNPRHGELVALSRREHARSGICLTSRP